LKIISLYTSKESSFIKRAQKQDRAAQKEIFEKYSPKMLSVCRMYVKDIHHAEDLMISGFLKVFTQIKSYQNKGSFEGWVRKIMINTCLSYLRKSNSILLTDEIEVYNKNSVDNFENTDVEDIQKLIDRLPTNYKLVFNLYEIEGFKHAEIAEKLKITVGTSKSQLFKAKKWLQEQYKKQNALYGDK